VEVYDEEGLVGLDLAAALVLLALDAAVPAGELGADCVGNVGNLPA